MATLLVSDLLKLFDNYEPSRTRVWEIVRTIHPVHCAALLYLLENVSKSRNAKALVPPADTDREGVRDNGPRVPDRIYQSAVRPTLNLTRATVTRQLRPVPRHGDTYIYDTRDASGNLTIIGLMRIVRDSDVFERLTLTERVVMHNLRTTHYAQFAQNVQYFLLPDDLQSNRNDFDTADTRNITQKFFQYYHSLGVADDDSRSDTALRYYGNLNPKSFRYITRPPCRQIDRRPSDSGSSVYTVQPLYRGYRVVINTNECQTRCYNCFGDLLHGFLYDARFTVNATFEAIVLPVDREGRLRSWHYGIHDGKAVAIIVVDVFRVDHQILVQLPFGERAAHIERIGGDNVRRPHAGCTWDSLERSYHTRADLYDPVVGVVLRHRQASCAEPPLAHLFNLTACYDFLTNTVTRLAGSVSLKEFQRVHYDLNMADRRTVCTVYAHDDQYYYVCTFDRRLYQFVHCASLDRLTDIARRRPKYRQEPIYVIGAKCMPKGVMFLRVYYSKHDLAVVGFEQKRTTSMYDVPFRDQFLCLSGETDFL